MNTMLELMNMELIGRHHSGIDDANNLCRIVEKLVNEDKFIFHEGMISDL